MGRHGGRCRRHRPGDSARPGWPAQVCLAEALPVDAARAAGAVDPVVIRDPVSAAVRVLDADLLDEAIPLAAVVGAAVLHLDVSPDKDGFGAQLGVRIETIRLERLARLAGAALFRQARHLLILDRDL